MKTLAEHNEERQEWYRRIDEGMQPQPNGIECPECGAELWDCDPTITLTSNPPQKAVQCPECGYIGYRLA